MSDENLQKAEAWFAQFPEGTFRTPAHKGTFLLGSLTQRLLNIQFREIGSSAFRSKLHGLRMRERDIKGLLPRISDKLEQYKSHYYKKLESVVSQYLLSSGANWDLSTDEINYMFILGMNLYNAKDNDGNRIFIFGEKEKEEKENE